MKTEKLLAMKVFWGETAPRANDVQHTEHWGIALEWKMADLWVGAFWKFQRPDDYPDDWRFDLWVCLVPCLPLHGWWRR